MILHHVGGHLLDLIESEGQTQHSTIWLNFLLLHEALLNRPTHTPTHPTLLAQSPIMVRPSKIEFPNLAGEGLYAAKTSGNGKEFIAPRRRWQRSKAMRTRY